MIRGTTWSRGWMFSCALVVVPTLAGAQGLWTATSTTFAPTARTGHTAVWTGTEMIVWGGDVGGFTLVNTGGVYDPASDTWTPMGTVGAPTGRIGHTAVWTGTKMIVWGGTDEEGNLSDTGGVYDPVSDTWTPTSTAGVPQGRERHTAVWTGTKMIVWGGADSLPWSPWTDTGGIYDPATNTWAPTSTTGAPTARGEHSAVWTGTRMIVWGGEDIDGAIPNTGGIYDPVANTWTPTSAIGAPGARKNHTAVWTGTKMIVWGGVSDLEVPVQTGGALDPTAATWTALTLTAAPTARYYHAAVWTGTKMTIWGGVDGWSTGGIYNPGTDAWASVSTTGAPTGSAGHTGVWTGTTMIVWGGEDIDGNLLNTGGILTPEAVAFELRLTKTGAGGGTVSSDPAGINCGAGCPSASHAFLSGTVVTLTATPDASSTFAGWSGDCAGTSPSCEMTLDAARSVSASFVPLAGTHTLTVVKEGTGTGAVTSSPAGIDCGADCSEAYLQGTTVTLTATPSADSAFGGWTGDCTGSSLQCQVTLSAARTVTAVFQLLQGSGFHTITPCRRVDTRSAALGGPTPLAAGIETDFVLVGGDCGIPATATAVSLNLTATAQTTAGHLRLYPGGTTPPNVSSLNYAAGQTRANNAIVLLGALGDVGVLCVQASGTAHVIIDVNGYFE